MREDCGFCNEETEAILGFRATLSYFLKIIYCILFLGKSKKQKSPQKLDDYSQLIFFSFNFQVNGSKKKKSLWQKM